MNLDPDIYLHDSDKAAMAALKAIPGFSQVMKAFMKIWNEQQFKIINMSTNLKLGESQMAKYYRMLEPVCQKLNIEMPELYVQLDVNPNAYTYGDTKPFIVLTSGLLKALPDELIPTVLAHECGHIACHHTLYTTMSRVLINGAAAVVLPSLGLGDIALYPIKLAAAYWMRCSEFSADRAAVIYDGGCDNTVRLCMYFAGYDKNIAADIDPDAFMEQAAEYRRLINDSAFNKTMEFLTFMNSSHPINAVRALECKEWAATERFKNILLCMRTPAGLPDTQMPVEVDPSKYLGKDISETVADLERKGFKNITAVKTAQSEKPLRNGTVTRFSINGRINGSADWYRCNSIIYIDYFQSDAPDYQEPPLETGIGDKLRDIVSGSPVKNILDEGDSMVSRISEQGNDIMAKLSEQSSELASKIGEQGNSLVSKISEQGSGLMSKLGLKGKDNNGNGE